MKDTEKKINNSYKLPIKALCQLPQRKFKKIKELSRVNEEGVFIH